MLCRSRSRTDRNGRENGIDVEVTKNKVLLSGTAANKAVHDQAMQIARSLGQTDREVVDHITIADAGTSSYPIEQQFADDAEPQQQQQSTPKFAALIS